MKKIGIISFVVILWYINLVAQRISGTEIFPFLNFNPDTKTSATAVESFSEEAVNNPAGIQSVNQSKCSFCRAELTEGMNYNYFSFILPVNMYSLGISAGYLDYGKIKGVNMFMEEYELPQSYDSVVVISYSRRIISYVPVYTEYGDFGVNLKYIRSSLAGEIATALCMDVGGIINVGKLLTNYRIVKDDNVELFNCSLVYRNLGPNAGFENEQFSLPSMFVSGININFPTAGKKNVLYLQLSLPVTEKLPTYSVGINFQPSHFIELRTGYKFSDSLDKGLTFGFGLNFNRLRFNYSLKEFREFTTLYNLGFIHQVSLEFLFGNFIKEDVGIEFWFRQQMNDVVDLYYQQKYNLAKQKIDELLKLRPDYQPAISLAKKIVQKMKEIEKDRQKQRIKWLTKADKCLRNKDLYNAKKYYEYVLTFYPEDTTAIDGLQTVNHEIEKLKQYYIAQQNKQKIITLWNEGVKFYNKGELLKAKEKFVAILTLDPNHQQAKDAVNKVEQQIAKFSSHQIEQLFKKGMELYNQGFYTEAIKYFEAILIADPTNANVKTLLDKSREILLQAEEQKRIQEITRQQQKIASELDRMMAEAVSLYKRKDYTKSIEKFEQIVKYATKYQQVDFVDQAQEYISNIKKEVGQKYFEEGMRLFKAEKYEQAYFELAKSVEYFPSNKQAMELFTKVKEILGQKFYEEGMKWYSKGLIEEAKQSFRRALFFNPDKIEAQRALERLK